MTADTMSLADADIHYLKSRAGEHEYSERDEDVFLEMVGKNHSDGMRDLEARAVAFDNWKIYKGLNDGNA